MLCVPERQLSYAFMAAEAYWILSGDNRVETIAPYNQHISQFSDDGTTFFGAYGPKIFSQLDYVILKLCEDPGTRQAGLTIWQENPPSTKDVPCTIAVFFNIRNLKLNCHIFMRSSDIWLGLPYDVFNFSMLAHLVCAELNQLSANVLEPGLLYLTMASSHLYDTNFDQAIRCTSGQVALSQNPTPEQLFMSRSDLMTRLRLLRDTKPGDHLRWWEVRDEA